MQIFVLLLSAAIIAPHEIGGWPRAQLSGWPLFAAAFVPYVALIALQLFIARRATWKLDHQPGDAAHTLRTLRQGEAVARLAALAMTYLIVFAVGWPGWLAERIGVVPMAAELAVLLPALAVPIAGWWAQHPVERRLHDSAMMRRLDTGLPITPMPRRAAYTCGQVRHQVLLVLVPVLIVLLWIQIVRRYIQPGAYESVFAIGGGAAVLVFAPLIIRYLWDTEPMPAGPVRDMLQRVCRANRVKVRELLLWRTHTGMVNGAVMGLVAPLRYVMLTDGLLEQLSPPQVEAVMAHELGHVRRKHMPWLVICAFGAMGLALGAIDVAVLAVDLLGGSAWLDGVLASPVGDALAGGAMLAAASVWAIAFGYASRRFERQADTFAVQHMARAGGEHAEPTAPADGKITPQAVDAMAGALEEVAALNHASRDRFNWRHGSIDWRVRYLRSLVGQPIDGLAIDRQVRWLCVAGAVMFLASMGMTYWLGVPG